MNIDPSVILALIADQAAQVFMLRRKVEELEYELSLKKSLTAT